MTDQDFITFYIENDELKYKCNFGDPKQYGSLISFLLDKPAIQSVLSGILEGVVSQQGECDEPDLYLIGCANAMREALFKNRVLIKPSEYGV